MGSEFHFSSSWHAVAARPSLSGIVSWRNCPCKKPAPLVLLLWCTRHSGSSAPCLALAARHSKHSEGRMNPKYTLLLRCARLTGQHYPSRACQHRIYPYMIIGKSPLLADGMWHVAAARHWPCCAGANNCCKPPCCLLCALSANNNTSTPQGQCVFHRTYKRTEYTCTHVVLLRTVQATHHSSRLST